jgi:hypothetical protein
MIETITAALTGVVDRLIALVREGKSTRRELFENHLEPIFHMLEEVIADYLALFAELEKEFQDSTVAPSITIEKIIERRRTTAMLREKTMQYADALYDAFEDEEIQRFALNCRTILRREPSYVAQMGNGIHSALTGMVSEISRAVVDYHDPIYEFHFQFDIENGFPVDFRAVIDSTPRELFSLIVRANRKSVESAWSRAAEIYYRLKIRLLR